MARCAAVVGRLSQLVHTKTHTRIDEWASCVAWWSPFPPVRVEGQQLI